MKFYERSFQVSCRHDTTMSDGAIRYVQDSALRRAGWREGIPVRRYERYDPDGFLFSIAETDLSVWRHWWASNRFGPRLRIAWFNLRARFA